jgi:hypothetical protein
MDPTALALLAVVGLLILMLPVLGLIAFAFIAVVIFVWRKIFPLGWGIAEWVTNRRNLIPFVLFMLIVIAGSIILMIVSYIFASQVHWLGYLFLLLFLLILVIAEIIFWGGVGLAVILWIVRLSHWAYALFRRGFWRTFRPQPVPVPLTNPVSITPPPVKSSYSGRRKLSKRRSTTGNPVTTNAKTPEVKAQASTQQKAKAGAGTKVHVKKTKGTAKAQVVFQEPAQARAREEAKKAKEQARDAKKNQAMAEAEDKARTKEEAKQDIAEEKSGEITNPGRRRRLRRNR